MTGLTELAGCRYVTYTGRATAEDAAQIFGGRSVTQTGMGKLIENVCAITRSFSSYLLR